jgi:hypothetical protein
LLAGLTACTPADPAGDPSALVAEALAAREAGDLAEVEALLQDAAAPCADRVAREQLQEAAGVAQRWALALHEDRPEAMFRYETAFGLLDPSDAARRC